MEQLNYAQDVFNLISGYLPSAWKKVVFYAEYGEASFINEFYVKNSDGNFVKCFDLDIDEEDLDDLFDSTNAIIEEARSKLSPEDKWTNTTMVVMSNGSVKIDYDYTDLNEGSFDYLQNWRKKYL